MHLDAVPAVDGVDPPRLVLQAIESDASIRIQRALWARVLVGAVHRGLEVQPRLPRHGLATDGVLHLHHGGLVGANPVPTRRVPQLPSAMEALVDDFPSCVHLCAFVEDTTPLLLGMKPCGGQLDRARVLLLECQGEVGGVAGLASLVQEGVRPNLLAIRDLAALQAHVTVGIRGLLRAMEVCDVISTRHVVVHLPDLAVEVQGDMPLAAIGVRARRPDMLPPLVDAREREMASAVAVVLVAVKEGALLVEDFAMRSWLQDDVTSLALQICELLAELRAIVAILLGQVPHSRGQALEVDLPCGVGGTERARLHDRAIALVQVKFGEATSEIHAQLAAQAIGLIIFAEPEDLSEP